MTDYYGIAEIAEALGVPKGRVAMWHSRGSLPAPIARLKMGPLWTGSQLKPLFERHDVAPEKESEPT